MESRKQLTSDTRNLTIIQLNIRALIGETSSLNKLLSENIGSIQPDVVLLCGTWLNITNIGKVDIPDYKLIGNVRNGKIGGGNRYLGTQESKMSETKRFRNKINNL